MKWSNLPQIHTKPEIPPTDKLSFLVSLRMDQAIRDVRDNAATTKLNWVKEIHVENAQPIPHQ